MGTYIANYSPYYYQMELGNKLESGIDFLCKIKKCLTQADNIEKPINILLITCYGGVLASAINYLPKGSSIVSLGNTNLLNETTIETFVQSIYNNPIKNCDLKPASLVSEYLMHSQAPAFPIINDAKRGLIDFGKVYDINFHNSDNHRKTFSQSEKENIYKQLRSHIDKETLELIIDKIESGDFSLKSNLGLALLICHAANFDIPLSFKKTVLKNQSQSNNHIRQIEVKIKKNPDAQNIPINFINTSQTEINSSFDNYLVNNSMQDDILLAAQQFSNTIITNKLNGNHEPHGLFIFGTPGIGKTHLCKTIAMQASENGLKVLYAHITLSNSDQVFDLIDKSDLIILDDFNDIHGEDSLQITMDRIIKGNKNLIIISNASQNSASAICQIRRIIFDNIFDNKKLINNFIVKNYEGVSYRKSWFETSTTGVDFNIARKEDMIGLLTRSPMHSPAGIVIEQNNTSLGEIKSLLINEGIREDEIKLMDGPFESITSDNRMFKKRNYYYGDDIDQYSYFVINVNEEIDCEHLIDILPFMYNYNKKLLICTHNEEKMLSLLNKTLNYWDGKYQNKKSPFNDRFNSTILTRKSFNELIKKPYQNENNIERNRNRM
jgi:DNA replication protein DnaC